MSSSEAQTSSAAPTDAGGKTISDWLGDMVALESHIEEALDRQLSVTKDSPTAAPAVKRFHDMVKGNRDALKARQAEIGTTAGNPIAQVGSTLLGKAAGLIDKVRAESISKALRDDYTAFNLAAVGHTMLHTTATALGDTATAKLAEKCLTGHAAAVQEINHIIQDVVLEELRKDNLPIVDANAPSQTRKLVDRVWKATATN
jgi:ferritin-like metal-binding protein YciE